MVWTVCLVMVGFVFGDQVEEAMETGWGIASVALLAAMILLAAFTWSRMDRIAKVGEKID